MTSYVNSSARDMRRNSKLKHWLSSAVLIINLWQKQHCEFLEIGFLINLLFLLCSFKKKKKKRDGNPSTLLQTCLAYAGHVECSLSYKPKWYYRSAWNDERL